MQPASRPDVDAIFGIPPTVAIEQRTSRGGRKSTVATLTEIYHFLRLLFVKLGTQYCPDCDVPIEPQSVDAIAARLLRDYRGQRIGAARAAGRQPQGLLHRPRQVGRGQGLHAPARGRRVPADRRNGRASTASASTRIELPVADLRRRRRRTKPTLREALARALEFGKGVVHVLAPLDGLMQGTAKVREAIFSTKRACPSCGRSFPELDPRLFSFNSKHGWCDEVLRHRRETHGIGLGRRARADRRPRTTCSIPGRVAGSRRGLPRLRRAGA